jgi:arsenate reductase (thioredoxin)
MLDDTPAAEPSRHTAEPSRHTAEPSRHSAEQDRGPGTCRKVLFLCTGNSCRSQMAEAWARVLHPHRLDAYSAGVQPHGLHPLAVRVMAEAGVDISGQRSKHVDELRDLQPDLVVTVCDHAAEVCPVFPGAARQVHHAFRDPAAASGSEAQRLDVFRRVRDEIRDFVATLADAEPGPAGTTGSR